MELEEKRYDEGKEFTYNEFIEFYGDEDGSMEWDSSEVVPQDKTKIIYINKVRTVTKKKLMKRPPKETKQLVKKVTRVPRVKRGNKTNGRISHSGASGGGVSGGGGRSGSGYNDNDGDSDGGRSEQSQAISTTSSSRSKLDSWLGKSTHYMHLKDEHCSPPKRISNSAHTRTNSQSIVRQTRTSVSHDAIDHFGRRDEEVRHNYINNMARDPDAMIETRRVKTDNGVWRTEVIGLACYSVTTLYLLYIHI